MFGRVWTLIETQGRLYSRLEEKTGECERLKAQCDFLAARLTVVETERAVLLERLLGVAIPVAEIAREERPPSVRLTPEALAALPPQFAPMPEGEIGRVYRPPSAEATPEQIMADNQALFEDVGDERAARMGLRDVQ